MKFSVRFLLVSAVAVAATHGDGVAKVPRSDKNVKGLVESVQSNLKRAATMGVALGTSKAAQKMQINILLMLHEFIKTLQGVDMRQAISKYQRVEDTIERDKKAIAILSNAMRLATNTETLSEYREALKRLSSASKNQTSTKRASRVAPKSKTELVTRLESDVNGHVNFLRNQVDATVKDTLARMQPRRKKSESGSTPTTTVASPSSTHANDIFQRDIHNLPPLFIGMPVWPARLESFFRFRRQNDDNDNDDVRDNEISSEQKDKENQTEEEDDDDEFGGGFDAPDTAAGGIAGLIGSLSGGDGGSDVGALVGAISGLVTTLFGPGGLDVPSLIATGTSLISGLLGGDQNFGKVLGSYIGLAVEGLSGGGGADNNGAFFGNFVGTLFAQLSADPEEEDVPPKPKIFIDNFFKGIEQSKQKRGVNETSSSSGNHKSYIFEFLSNILSSVVGGITNLVLNASFGSSGGSSNGVTDLSAGSSQGSHAGSAYASQSSASSSMMPSQTNGKPK